MAASCGVSLRSVCYASAMALLQTCLVGVLMLITMSLSNAETEVAQYTPLRKEHSESLAVLDAGKTLLSVPPSHLVAKSTESEVADTTSIVTGNGHDVMRAQYEKAVVVGNGYLYPGSVDFGKNSKTTALLEEDVDSAKRVSECSK
jgi:hypothetical protein